MSKNNHEELIDSNEVASMESPVILVFMLNGSCAVMQTGPGTSEEQAIKNLPDLGQPYLVLDSIPENIDDLELVDGALQLSAAKGVAKQIVEVEKERDEALYSAAAAVSLDGVTYQMDPKTRGYLLEVINIYNAVGSTPDNFEWRDTDNNMHSADLQFLVRLAQAKSEQERDIWNKSFADKAAIRTASIA